MSDPTYGPLPTAPADRSVKVPHLVFGLLFLGFAAIWVLGASNVLDGEQLAVLAPGVLILAGVIGLAASLASGRNRRRAAAARYQEAGHQETPSHDASAEDTEHTTHLADDSDGNRDEHTQEIR